MNARRHRAGVGLAAVAVVVASSGAIRAVASPRAVAFTVSGLPASPYAERSLRVAEAGVAVRFRSPASTDLARVATFWERGDGGCTLTLHAGRPGAGPALGEATVPAGAGWRDVPLAAPLVRGRVYRLAVRCPTSSRARLGYVLDREHRAVDRGKWRLERLRGGFRRAPASPLFALGFANGTSWGQPYRPASGGGALPLGGGRQARVVVFAGKPLAIHGVHVPLRAPKAAGYSVSLSGGSLLAEGDVTPGERPRRKASRSAPVALRAGATYVVRLAASQASAHGPAARALGTDLALGPPLSGLQPIRVQTSDDGGHTWHDDASQTVDASFLVDGPADDGVCGNGALEPSEGCDGAADSACPGRCGRACLCVAPPAAAEAAYRSIYAAGFVGAYDHNGATVDAWPRKLGLIEADGTNAGGRIAGYKRLSVAAGNGAATYWFYSSLTSIDARCACRDQRMYEAFTKREDFWLHDATGGRISTFVAGLGRGRQIATDVGNPAFTDAWAKYQLETMQREGWDGVWADNIICAWDVGTNWSATPVNPRTGAPYQLADYRRDLATALGRIHDRLAAAGKQTLGNHGGSCVADFFRDAAARDQLRNMDGSAIENCVYDFWDVGCGCNRPLSESVYIDQLRYLFFANHSGKQTECILQHGGIDTAHRSYGLASYLLTKEGFSALGELNHASEYWTGPPGGTHGLDTELGAPTGDFYCLDPGRRFARQPNGAAGCPAAGKLYGRDFAFGKVLTNPTATTYTVDLGGAYVCDGTRTTRVTLSAKSGAVCDR